MVAASLVSQLQFADYSMEKSKTKRNKDMASREREGRELPWRYNIFATSDILWGAVRNAYNEQM